MMKTLDREIVLFDTTLSVRVVAVGEDRFNIVLEREPRQEFTIDRRAYDRFYSYFKVESGKVAFVTSYGTDYGLSDWMNPATESAMKKYGEKMLPIAQHLYDMDEELRLEMGLSQINHTRNTLLRQEAEIAGLQYQIDKLTREMADTEKTLIALERKYS